MLDLAQRATAQAYNKLLNKASVQKLSPNYRPGQVVQQEQTIEGVSFNVYLDVDKGVITNVHPQ